MRTIQQPNLHEYNRNGGKKWTPQNVRDLRSLLMQGFGVIPISLKLGRTESAVGAKIVGMPDLSRAWNKWHQKKPKAGGKKGK